MFDSSGPARLGIYDAIIVSSSGVANTKIIIINNIDSNNEMDKKAKRMTQEDHSNLDTATSRKSASNEKGWHNFAFPGISIGTMCKEEEAS